MSYNCLGSNLLKDIRSRLTPTGNSGQRHVGGENAAKAAAIKISRGEAKDMAMSQGIYSYGGPKQYVTGTNTRVKDFVHDTMRDSRKAVQAFRTFHRADGAGSGMPDITTAALRMRFGYVPQNTNSSLGMTPTGTLEGMGVAVGGRGLLGAGDVSPAGSVPLDPNRPMNPRLSLRAALWRDRMYGGVPLPSGLGAFDFSSILAAAGSSGGTTGTIANLASGLLPKPKSAEEKAAEKTAAAAQKQLKAAKLAAASAAEGRSSMQRMLLIGGGVVVAGTLAYFLLRKKK